MERGTPKDSPGLLLNTPQSIRRNTSQLMFGRDIRTKLLNLVEEDDKTTDIRKHHKQYTDKIKDYADKTNRAKEHNVEVGHLMYIASIDNGKLDSKFRDTPYVLLRNTSDHSFELVNTEDRSRITRNVKHLCHTPVVIDLEAAVPAEAHEDTRVLDMQDAQSAPAECPQEAVPVPDQRSVTRSGRVIKKPARYRDT